MSGSSYINSSNRNGHKKIKKRRFLPVFFVIIGVLFGSLGLAPFIAENSTSNKGNQIAYVAEAWPFCANPASGDLGSFMEPTGWKTAGVKYPASDVTPRKLTLQEAGSQGVKLPTFSGIGTREENGTTDFVNSILVGSDGIPKDGEIVQELGLSAETIDKMAAIRTGSHCFGVPVAKGLATMIMGVAGWATNFGGMLTSMAFDPAIVCDDANTTQKSCVNILAIIGGTDKSGDEGILGNLRDGIYFPLLVLAGIIVGAWVVYVGIAKRQIMQALQGVLWAIIATVLGVFVLMMPQVVAQAPMFINNQVVTVLFSAASGSNGDSTSKTNFCNSYAADHTLEMSVNNMNCNIWKAFVMEPYAQAAFGTTLNQLNFGEGNDTVADKAIAKAGYAPTDFCYNLNTTKKLDDQMSGPLELSGSDNQLCNLAAAQLMFNSNVTEGEGKAAPTNPNVNDRRWLKLAAVAAQDDNMWFSWVGTNWMSQISYAMIGLLAAIAANFVIIAIAFFATMYYFVSLIMMIFLPFFLLIGIIPGRGKKILMTWAQTVLGNIMKYMASALFLVITVSIYAGVLSQVDNIFTTFIFVVILTGALLMYRKEIINLLGKVELGGEAITNKAANLASKVGQRAGAIGVAAGGATAGAVIANGVQNPFRDLSTAEGMGGKLAQLTRNVGGDIKQGVGSAGSGFASGAFRAIKSRNDLLGNISRSTEMASASNKKKALADKEEAANMAGNEEATMNATKAAINEAITARDAASKTVDATNGYIAKHEVSVTAFESAINNSLDPSRAGSVGSLSPEYAQWRELTDRAENLKIQGQILQKAGDTDGYNAAMSELNSSTAAADSLKTQISPSDFVALDTLYKEQVETDFTRSTGKAAEYDKLDEIQAKYYTASGLSQYNEGIAKQKNSEVTELQEQYVVQVDSASAARAEADLYSERATELDNKKFVSGNKSRSTSRKISNEINDQVDRMESTRNERGIPTNDWTENTSSQGTNRAADEGRKPRRERGGLPDLD